MANPQTRQPAIEALQQRIGHTFRQLHLLQRALTHSSLAYEQATEERSGSAPTPQIPALDLSDNEQLEFLGDAVVGLIAADSLYRRYPELQEGELTRLRAALVSRKHLGQVAAKLDLGAALFLGKGEERSGGRKKAALLANTIEAVIGALYLDGGLEAARVFVEHRVVEPYVGELRATIERGGSIGDYKSALQEFLQARKIGQPQYVIKGESGPDHRKRFLIEVRMASAKVESEPRILARGSGTTKKLAEQEAARRAYLKLLHESDQSSFESAERLPEELVS
ncbi:Ribonuclease III [Acidisarcina polymorpha]|uniref:Ribonuclease 3 n=1 Tax=Acidisarcina polymorpha TaxID=2211140 RepID=A0A2Z5FV98_9BACT|nr:ribonuclease III [Acidisarcina polymorpha]AXC10788.1 Ribonuclease III [Acidisarcina polymorpha]